MLGRASIVGAAETSVGKVREHNEDSHFIDPEAGIFIVCDGMGGHAAGEVASALAVKTIRRQWSADAMQTVADRWLAKGTPEARKQLLTTVTSGVLAAHEAIVGEAAADSGKKGMGTTVVAAIVVGGDVVFAHCGDSRAYLVRDGITMQLTEDHTLLARLLAAGVDVDVDGDGSRFKSMLTNALGIGHECKVSCFVVPVADGDRFLLCSDGITEYLQENEIGEVLTTQPSPARSAQRLVEIALDRGGGDNATALVVRVLEAGETARPADALRRDEKTIHSCPLLEKLNPQQKLRSLRIALPREYAKGEKVPAQTLGDRVAWIIVDGEVNQDGVIFGPGALLYPEALLADRPLPDKEGLAVAQSDMRLLALRSDDFRELCDDDPEIGEHLLAAVGSEIQRRRPGRRTGKVPIQPEPDPRGATDPGIAYAPTLERMKPIDPIDPDGPEARGETLRRPAVMDPNGPEAIGQTLRRPAVDGNAEAIRSTQRGHAVAPRGDTIPPATKKPDAADIGRMDTMQRPAVEPPPPTNPPPFASTPATELPKPAPDATPIAITQEPTSKPNIPIPDPTARQPRGSTVPPETVRRRATTDHGTPIAGAEEGEEARARRPRGTTPPSEKSRSSLIVPPADTAAAVEDALDGLTEDADAPDDAEISIEPETQPAMPSNARPTPASKLRPPAPPALRPPAPRAAAPAKQVSEPEIQIEELVELVDESDDETPAVAEAEQHVTLSLDDVDDRAASDPGIIVPADAPRSKRRPTNSPD